MQKRRNCSAVAMELRLSCTNLSKYYLQRPWQRDVCASGKTWMVCMKGAPLHNLPISKFITIKVTNGMTGYVEVPKLNQDV